MVSSSRAMRGCLVTAETIMPTLCFPCIPEYPKGWVHSRFKLIACMMDGIVRFSCTFGGRRGSC